ncbi:MAG: DUF262 domain-containing HNH endonuclease family protein [Treponemataceae bacterium]|nr:DUF262 domain-containing HNH endonuclease family protein [Treponemataceae bacterium]
MSKLNIDQKTIFGLFADKKSDFLIPDYQRPYAWEDAECQTLWEDIFNFAFPDNDYSKFDSDSDEYFLGPIVTFKNDSNKMEVIDGQQRLTTLMLLLRAFYEKFGMMQDENSKKTRENLEKCIWKTDEFGTPDKSKLKIDSEVATDNDKDEFLNILKNGSAPENMKSKYAINYRFFQKQINEFLQKFPSYFSYLPTRILNNCILLPIEAESQDTALRIFSTLNDRGLPLSDADIFKAQFYKYYTQKGEKDDFIKRWKAIEEQSAKIFHPITGTPMDELFTRYMYYERACRKIKSSTTEALRKFYEKDSYALLKKDETLENLEALADFWNDVSNQDKERFSDEVLRRLYVLNYAPNGMWNYFTSVYFMRNKDADGKLDDAKFCAFLTKITAFIWTYAVTNPGVNALRTPVYAEMVNLVEGKDIEFAEFKFEAATVKSMFNNYYFSNGRPITKSMLTWWAFNDKNQPLLSLESVFEIEHIFARKRQEHENALSNTNLLESLGNKSILEKRINIRASDYRFEDKKKYYKGFTNAKGQNKEGTQIIELQNFAKNKNDFTETDITARHDEIIDAFIGFLKQNDLLK